MAPDDAPRPRAAPGHPAGHGHHGHHHRRPKKSPWPLVIGAGVAAIVLPFLIMLIGGGSYYREQQPDALADLAEQQITRGEFSAAFNNVNLALLRSPDAGTRERLEQMRTKIASATVHSADKEAVALGTRGAEAIREIDRQYPAAGRTRPAARELANRAKKWLERFEGLASANPELDPLVKEMQAVYDLNKVQAQLDRPDDAADVLFQVDRRLAMSTPMWRESVKAIVDYVAAHQSDPQIHAMNARKVEIIDKAKAAFDRHEAAARAALATGSIADANKELDAMRNAIVVPGWSSRADALERDIGAKK